MRGTYIALSGVCIKHDFSVCRLFRVLMFCSSSPSTYCFDRQLSVCFKVDIVSALENVFMISV